MTLTPESWTIEKTMKEFEVSKCLVKKSRSLIKKPGILAEPKAKTAKFQVFLTLPVWLTKLTKKWYFWAWDPL